MTARRAGATAAALALGIGLAAVLGGCGNGASSPGAGLATSSPQSSAALSVSQSPPPSVARSSVIPSAKTRAATTTPEATPSSWPKPDATTSHALDLRGPQPLPSQAVVVPTRVEIPAIDVDSTLEHLRLVKGVLQPPTDPDRAGWWAGGPVPGDPGPAVIAGHLDSFTGPAVFIDLSSLEAGDKIYVDRSDGRRSTFVVDAVQVYDKTAFPTDAVYGVTPGSALRLITCGGTYDRQQQLYLANVIVYATLAT